MIRMQKVTSDINDGWALRGPQMHFLPNDPDVMFLYSVHLVLVLLPAHRVVNAALVLLMPATGK